MNLYESKLYVGRIPWKPIQILMFYMAQDISIQTHMRYMLKTSINIGLLVIYITYIGTLLFYRYNLYKIKEQKFTSHSSYVTS